MPVSPERLHDAVGRVRRRLVESAPPAPPASSPPPASTTTPAPSPPLAAPASPAPPPREYPARLAVPIGSRLRFIATEDIDYIAAAANYAEIHVGGHAFVMRETMASLEARLDPRAFLRIHRSRIVRLAAIEDIEPLASGQYVIRLKSGVRLSSGRSYRPLLQKALGLAPSP